MQVRQWLHNEIEGSQSLAGRIFNLLIQILIIISIFAFSLETLPDLDDGQRHALHILELIIVAIFIVEYLLRLYAAPKRLSYVFSFYGIIDLVSILPSILTSTLDLRGLRIFRLLRLIRILKLVRYNVALRRFLRAFLVAREEIILFGVVALMLLYVGAVGIYYFEHEAQPQAFKSIFHSLWWAVATLTTVGYGDVYPITLGGRVFTFLLLMVGLGVVSVPAGVFAQALSKVDTELPKE